MKIKTKLFKFKRANIQEFLQPGRYVKGFCFCRLINNTLLYLINT